MCRRVNGKRKGGLIGMMIDSFSSSSWSLSVRYHVAFFAAVHPRQFLLQISDARLRFARFDGLSSVLVLFHHPPFGQQS